MATKEVCKRFNEWGDCIEWVKIGNQDIATISEEATECNPELAKQAKERLKRAKILTED